MRRNRDEEEDEERRRLEEMQHDDATFWAMLNNPGSQGRYQEPSSPPPAMLSPLRGTQTARTISKRKRTSDADDEEVQRYEATPRLEEVHRSERMYPPRGSVFQEEQTSQFEGDAASNASSSRFLDDEERDEAVTEMDNLDKLIGTDDFALERALQKLDAANTLEMEEAFEILLAVARRDARVLTAIPIRSTASPLSPAVGSAYLACRRLAVHHRTSSLDQTSQQPNTKKNVVAYPVAFQSILNSDIWWCPSARHLSTTPRLFETIGIVSRPMSRSQQLRGSASTGTTGQKEAKRTHGYRGRMFSLVRRDSSKKPRKADGIPISLLGDAHLVCVWPDRISRPSSSTNQQFLLSRHTDDHEEERSQSLPPLPRSTRSQSRSQQHHTIPHSDHVIQGHLRVSGDLFVDGTIHGTLQTANADYAEWFPCTEEGILPGSVVCLTPHRTLTLNTSWNKAPLFVVSSAPSVSANTPLSPQAHGAMVAFLGQVPVRCRGPVSPGDCLIPSGRHDGTAIAQASESTTRIIGLAISSATPTSLTENQESSVMCLIRWGNPPSQDYLKHIEPLLWAIVSTVTLTSVLCSTMILFPQDALARYFLHLLTIFISFLFSTGFFKSDHLSQMRLLYLALLFYPTFSLALNCISFGPPTEYEQSRLHRLYSLPDHLSMALYIYSFLSKAY